MTFFPVMDKPVFPPCRLQVEYLWAISPFFDDTDDGRTALARWCKRQDRIGCLLAAILLTGLMADT